MSPSMELVQSLLRQAWPTLRLSVLKVLAKAPAPEDVAVLLMRKKALKHGPCKRISEKGFTKVNDDLMYAVSPTHALITFLKNVFPEAESRDLARQFLKTNKGYIVVCSFLEHSVHTSDFLPELLLEPAYPDLLEVDSKGFETFGSPPPSIFN